jgi:hypothetical protein
MYCTSCKNSASTQKVSSIYLAGTSETYSSGSACTTFKQNNLHQNQDSSAHTNSSSYSLSQTKLAQLCSPPAAKLNPFLLFLGLLFIEYIFINIFGLLRLILLFPIWIIIPLPFVYYNLKWNKNVYPLIYKQWEKKYYCHKCDLFL